MDLDVCLYDLLVSLIITSFLGLLICSLKEYGKKEGL